MTYYLCCKAEAALWLHHLLQNMVLDPSWAHVLIYNTMFQVNIIHHHINQWTISRQGQMLQTADYKVNQQEKNVE